MNYEQSNVGLGMVPCKKYCRCDDCTIERLTAELAFEKRERIATAKRGDASRQENKQLTAEVSKWKNAARVMAALYGRHVEWDGGSWFRDNIEISLDEDLPAASIEELLQVAWKANKDGVTEALATDSGSQEQEPWDSVVGPDEECTTCGGVRYPGKCPECKFTYPDPVDSRGK